MISFILFLSLVIYFGVLFQTGFGQKNVLEKIGNGILHGSFIMTVIMLLDYQIFNSFSITRVITIIFSISMFATIVYYKQLLELIIHFRRMRLREMRSDFLLISILVFVLVTLVINYVVPISDWDAIALYDFRAQVIKTGSWDIGVILGYFFHYPPFTSLLHASAYLLNFERAKVFYSILFVGFLLSFYSLLNRRVSSKRSLFGVFLLILSPLLSGHVLIAYTNLSYAIYFCLGIIYTWEWIDKKNNTDLTNAFIYLSASLWIRQAEPFWIVPLVFILLGLFFSKNKSSHTTIVSGLLLFVGMYKYWPVYVASLNLPSPTNTSLNDGAIPEKIVVSLGTIVANTISVINHLIKYFFIPLITSIIPVVIVLLLDKKLREEKYIMLQAATITIFFIFVAGGTLIFSFTYATWDQIGGSLTRMVMFFEPLLIYLLMFSNLWFLDNQSDVSADNGK